MTTSSSCAISPGCTGSGIGARGVILPDRPGRPEDFWRGVQEGVLLLQRCRCCGRWWHPIAEVCEACQSFDLEPVASAGLGAIYSFTVVHHAVHPVVQRWVPYTICLVTLDEGPRILSTVDPDDGVSLQIDGRVRLGFRRVHPELQLPVFTSIST